MVCIICNAEVKGADIKNIALDPKGRPVMMCDECYSKSKWFFKEDRRRGKINSRRSDEGCQQEVQS